MSMIFGGGGDATKAAERQIEEQRRETQRLRDQAEQERADYAAQLAGRRKASQRGGSRALLSEARVNPETGLPEEPSNTLGAA